MRWTDVFPYWEDACNISIPPFWDEGPKNEEEMMFAIKVERYPKFELHLHAEAAVWPVFYDRYNDKLKRFPFDQMPCRRAPFINFEEFVKAWMDNLSFASDSHFYYELALGIAQRQSDQNIVYSEVHFSPLDSSFFRERFFPDSEIPVLDVEQNINSFLEGIKTAEMLFPDITIRAILDIVSVSTVEEREHIYDILSRLKDKDRNLDMQGRPILIAIGLGGPEYPENCEQDAAFLNRLRVMGFFIDIHSGEGDSVTPAQHKRAVETIRPHRIGHGFRGADIDYFFSGHIATCPSSHLLTQSFRGSLTEHPIKKMKQSGCSFFCEYR